MGISKTKDVGKMRRPAPISLRFVYSVEMSGVGINSVYNRIFVLAKKRMELDKHSNNYGRDGKVLNVGRDSRIDESRTDNCLSHVSVRKNTRNKVWKSLADKQDDLYKTIKGERKT
jgi:hypothetical protein